MKLKPEEKTGDMIRELQAINDSCFTGEERPGAGMFEYRMETGEVFLKRNEYEIAGFAIVDDNGSEARIWTIGVKPEARRLGFGKQLLRDISEEYTKDITLTTRVDNVPAIVLYLKSGYRVEKLLRRYYPGGVDGILMRRKHDN